MKYASYPSYTWPNGHTFSRGDYKVVNSMKNAYTTMQVWRSRTRQRRRPAQFDDRLLRDIGITRVDAWVETTKPFWKA